MTEDESGINPDIPTTSEVERRVRLLERTPVFDLLAAGDLRALARRMRQLNLAPGETVAVALDSGEQIMLLDRGDCTHTIRDGSGEVVYSVSPQPGDRLVAPSALPGGQHEATIAAQRSTTVLVLDRQSVQSALGKFAQSFAGEMNRLAQRDAALLTTAPMAGVHDANVIGVFGPKGGAGLTTVAVNLASVLGRARPNQVLLLDLALPFAHGPLYTDTVVTSSLATASRVEEDRFRPALWSAVHAHPSGLHLLTGAIIPEEADLVTGELVQRAITILRDAFSIIVVDLGNTLNEVALAVFEMAARAVIVLPPELAALRDVRRTTEILEEFLRLPAHRIDLVLNHRSPGAPLEQAAIETIVGRRISVAIPYDGSRPERALLSGHILAMSDPSSAISAGAWSLAALVAGKAMVSGS